MTFTPNEFLVEGERMASNGICALSTGQSAPCKVYVDSVTAGYAPTGARRILQLPLCTLITINIPPLDLNVLGLDVAVPSGLQVVITGTAGLLGDLLCGLNGLLSGLNLLAIANALNNLLAALGALG
ncbi:hypothetical protein WJX72_002798 [[Myrmecia] bisecta]|uniref:Uncharacterized protein n=1 Tax=[Myrmecia] bisecta TaxID=41462 RepID=A0AAW1QQT4_9CHLO